MRVIYVSFLLFLLSCDRQDEIFTAEDFYSNNFPQPIPRTDLEKFGSLESWNEYNKISSLNFNNKFLEITFTSKEKLDYYYLAPVFRIKKEALTKYLEEEKSLNISNLDVFFLINFYDEVGNKNVRIGEAKISLIEYSNQNIIPFDYKGNEFYFKNQQLNFTAFVTDNKGYSENILISYDINLAAYFNLQKLK